MNTVLVTLSLQKKKIVKIKTDVRQVLKKQSIILRTLARTIGLFSSSIFSVFLGRFFTELAEIESGKSKERFMLWRLLCYGDQIQVSVEAQEELIW